MEKYKFRSMDIRNRRQGEKTMQEEKKKLFYVILVLIIGVLTVISIPWFFKIL